MFLLLDKVPKDTVCHKTVKPLPTSGVKTTMNGTNFPAKCEKKFGATQFLIAFSHICALNHSL